MVSAKAQDHGFMKPTGTHHSPEEKMKSSHHQTWASPWTHLENSVSKRYELQGQPCVVSHSHWKPIQLTAVPPKL